jgi:hypothetical protein
MRVPFSPRLYLYITLTDLCMLNHPCRIFALIFSMSFCLVTGDLTYLCFLVHWGASLGYLTSFSFIYLLFGVTMFELSASHLQSSCSTAWAIPSVHFALVILKMGVSGTICLGWPGTTVLLISASQS